MEFAWFDIGDGRQVYRKVETVERKRSHLACPMLALDTMPETQSMLDGKVYTSKAKLRQTYREAGVTEVGNDAQRFNAEKPAPDRKKIKEAIGKAKTEYSLGRRFNPTPVQS